MTPTTGSNAIRRGLRFLGERQLPSGQFPVEATFHYKTNAPTIQDSSPFATAHIVHSLGLLPQSDVRPLLEPALTYLRSEMSGPGLWRYWNRDAVWGGRRIYSFIPADLDDTVSHSLLLKKHGIPFPENRSILLHNRNREGLFLTWFVPRFRFTADSRYWLAIFSEITPARLTVFWKTTEASYNDVDAVVNANVLLYLGESYETKPVIEWLCRIVEEEREETSDKWYRDRFTFFYALSRCYHAGIRRFGELAPRIMKRLGETVRQDHAFGDGPMHTALAVNTFLNMGIDSPLIVSAIDYLIEAQDFEGGWPSAPYYYGGPMKTVSWGGRELTTGLCLEAIQRHGLKNQRS